MGAGIWTANPEPNVGLSDFIRYPERYPCRVSIDLNNCYRLNNYRWSDCKESRSSIRRFLRTALIVQRNAGSRDGAAWAGRHDGQAAGNLRPAALQSLQRSEYLRRQGKNLNFARMPGKLIA
jgi:hypothetical protein